jgi:NAD(P)-dependent dehydrogenase (short-subunit alcohol dehydrogenase family)
MAASGGGSVINISSIDGMRAGSSRNVPYGITKGGIITLTRLAAVHHGRENVRVNSIAPGHLHTTFVGQIPQELRERRRKIAPLGTEGNAWDIAWAAVFLGSDESRWISGVVLPVDAGLFAGSPLSMYDNLSEE